MRDLPYVKFVDELYPDFYFHGALNYIDEMIDCISLNTQLSFGDLVRTMNVEIWNGLDSHTHTLKIGDISMSANSNEDRFIFDMYVFQALQQQYDEDIEFVSNSRFNLPTFKGGTEAELVDKIIIQGIPNYVGADGPYHECMEELRENKYLKDFRRWVIEQHNNLQRAEIRDICVAVERNMEEVQQDTFRKFLENNNNFSFFKSTGSTILKTTAGLFFSPISIADAFAGTIIKGKNTLDAKSLRWQGFVMDSREIMGKIE